ncbi:MAG: hypothetical protein LBT20_02895, partial [Clostridiales bacterium]|nr:hypothetical protein [Clostridiales bacterium]
KELAKEAYFLAFANPNDGKMYFCFAPITKPLSIEIMQFNHSEISVYTYHDYNARSIAQQAGQNFSPIHDFATKSGYFNHYHMGDRPHEVSYSHAFYGLPIFF